MSTNSFDSTKKNFIKYLDNLGLTPATHKNYRSDLSHFTVWLISRIRSFGSYADSLTDAVPFLSTKISQEYKSFLLENNIPTKTINRRLSTMRHLAKFMLGSNLMDSNFMESIENVSDKTTLNNTSAPLLNDFQDFLESEKVSKNTVKNYLSDVRQFLAWIEEK